MRTKEWHEAREARKQKWVSRLRYISAKLHAVAWIAAAVLVLYYSNFFYVVWNSSKINSLFFGISLVLFGAFASMVIYASFFISSKTEIEVAAPRLIPVASVVGFICFLTSHVAFWPVWGWMTPLILGVMQLGYIMAGSFLPKSIWGSISMVGLFMVAAMSSRFIPHEGLLG